MRSESSARGHRVGALVGAIGARSPLSLQGGVETYCRTVYPLLAKHNCSVKVFTRRCYSAERETVQGVEYIPVRTIRSKQIETALYTPIALFLAKASGCQVIHFHGIGPAMYTPLAKLLGMKVIIRHVGRCYDRKKWGWAGRGWLRTGEWMGSRFANVVTFLTDTSESEFRLAYKHRCRTITIENAVPAAQLNEQTTELERHGLVPGKYLLYVGRLVPEKSIETLIRSYSHLGLRKQEWKIAIVGSVDFPGSYGRMLSRLAAAERGIVFVGMVLGERLQQFYTHAGAFVLPSTHEGMSFSLLEAMSYGLPCVVGDIPPNRAMKLPPSHYATIEDARDLAERTDAVVAAWSRESARAQIEGTRRRFGLERLVLQLRGEIAACIDLDVADSSDVTSPTPYRNGPDPD